MKSIVIVHDAKYQDVERMMSSIDYVMSTNKTFEGDFTIYCEESSPLAAVFNDSGLPLSTENFPEEPDTVIAFMHDLHDGTEASLIAMNQWQSRRPVYPFQLVKP